MQKDWTNEVPATCGGTQTAHDFLEQKAKRTEARADRMRILLAVVPWDNLTREQDDALWTLFCEMR